MKKTLVYSYGILILLTIITAIISKVLMGNDFVVSLILALAVFKFLLVSFQFMEMKKANSFWKISLIATLCLIVVLIIAVK